MVPDAGGRSNGYRFCAALELLAGPRRLRTNIKEIHPREIHRTDRINLGLLDGCQNAIRSRTAKTRQRAALNNGPVRDDLRRARGPQVFSKRDDSLSMDLSLTASTALQGIQNGRKTLVSGAHKALSGDLVQGSIDQSLATHQVKASAAVIRAVDESLGTLLDDLA